MCGMWKPVRAFLRTLARMESRESISGEKLCSGLFVFNRQPYGEDAYRNVVIRVYERTVWENSLSNLKRFWIARGVAHCNRLKLFMALQQHGREMVKGKKNIHLANVCRRKANNKRKNRKCL